jgi:hypothetical protein
MGIVRGAVRVITGTADTTTAAAGAIGGAAVNGVIGGVECRESFDARGGTGPRSGWRDRPGGLAGAPRDRRDRTRVAPSEPTLRWQGGERPCGESASGVDFIAEVPRCEIRDEGAEGIA